MFTMRCNSVKTNVSHSDGTSCSILTRSIQFCSCICHAICIFLCYCEKSDTQYCNRLDRKLTSPNLGTLEHFSPGLQLCRSTWTCWQGMHLMLLAQAVVREHLQRLYQVYRPLLCCHPGLRQGSLNSLLASSTISQLHLVSQSAKSGEHCR